MRVLLRTCPATRIMFVIILVLLLVDRSLGSFDTPLEYPCNDGASARWSVKVQAMVLTVMLERGISAYEAVKHWTYAYDGKPLYPRRTISRLMQHPKQLQRGEGINHAAGHEQNFHQKPNHRAHSQDCIVYVLEDSH